jgi:hypothetical protein
LFGGAVIVELERQRFSVTDKSMSHRVETNGVDLKPKAQTRL